MNGTMKGAVAELKEIGITTKIGRTRIAKTKEQNA